MQQQQWHKKQPGSVQVVAVAMQEVHVQEG